MGLAKEWVYFFKIKKQSVGAGNWRTFMSRKKFAFRHDLAGYVREGFPHKFFVANVNRNEDGNRKANVNRLSNDNVWNAENRNRVVVPKLLVSPATFAGVFVPILFSNRRVVDRLRAVSL